MHSVLATRGALITVLLVSTFEGIFSIRNLHIVSPIQSLTIWDPEVRQEEKTSFRSRFLPRFRAGLQAEVEARNKLAEQRTQVLAASEDVQSKDWAEKASQSDRRTRDKEERFVEAAYDEAVKKFDTQSPNKLIKAHKNANKFQFVGVINPSDSNKPITWYARKKPEHANWSLRLIHVNRNAVLKDLFNRGKIDVFAKYENTGKIEEKTGQPIVAAKYSVRERTWKNLWNFSPKHFFTDSSGMYWRERRLPPGMYTDGATVYEASYRYRDGRNGMKRLSNLQEFLNSRNIEKGKKERIIKRLREDAPDVVLED